MGRSTPTLREYLKSELDGWMRMSVVLSDGERRALRELLNAAVSRCDAGSLVQNQLPSDAMLMLIHLKARLNEIEGKLEKERPFSQVYWARRCARME